jgi:amino acid transporter
MARTHTKALAGGATLGVAGLAMIEITAVLGVRKFPPMAAQGWSMMFWYFAGLLVLLLPLSLVAGELGTAWPQGGGVYAWVREAFGERPGFIAIWSQWTECVVWYPTALAFVAATLAYVVSPLLGTGPAFVLLVMLAVLALAFVANVGGQRFGHALSTWGGALGVIVPTVVLVGLLVVSIAAGTPPAVPFSASALVPELNASTLPFAATVVLTFSGMQMAGYYALQTREPARDFARAVLLSMTAIFVLTVLGTLAIMWVVPTEELGLASGAIQAIHVMLDAVGAGWLTVPLAVLIAVGGAAQFSIWFMGPGKALGVAAAQGDLPPLWRRRNRHGSPVGVLVIQALVVTALSLLFVLVPSANAAYWILSAVTTQVLIIMYLFLFAAALKLRYSRPDTLRPYRVPGGKAGMWIVVGVAVAALVFTLVVGCLPPGDVPRLGRTGYVLFVAGTTVVLSVGAPLVIWLFRKPGWVAPDARAYLVGEGPGEAAGQVAGRDDEDGVRAAVAESGTTGARRS